MYNKQIIKEAIQRFYHLYEDEENTQNLDQDAQGSIEQAEIEDLSMLDQIMQGRDPKMGEIIRANVPMIYAFITKHVPDMIKIGYTDQGVYTRLKQWQKHYPDAELIGYWTATEFNSANERVYFKDYPVHKRTNKRGFAQITKKEKDVFKALEQNKDLMNMHVSSEFFHKYNNLSEEQKEELSPQIIEDIICELKKDIRENNNLTNVDLYQIIGSGDSTKADKIWKSPATFQMTALQNECIQSGVEAIARGDSDLLMCAVMRFGKTQATYHIIKEAKIRNNPIDYVLVTSAKADVRESWRSDINHVDLYKSFAFVEFIGSPNKISLSQYDEDKKVIVTNDYNIYDSQGNHIIDILRNSGKIVIVFTTLQDLSGTAGTTRMIKEQHKYLFDNPPQMIVIDETHYGSHSQVYGAATGLSPDEYSKQEIEEAKNEQKDAKKYGNVIKAIHADVRLQCSGTPYYILQSGEFKEDIKGKTIITKVSFSDMIKARDEWAATHEDSEQSESPYFGVPNIIKFGMQLTKKCQKALAECDISTKMTELFRQDNDMKFIHEEAIIEMMTAIFGKAGSQIGFLNQKQIVNGEIFKHCILVLPRIDACNEVKKLLLDNNIIDPEKREIIVMVEKRTKKSEGGMTYDPDAKTVAELNDKIDKLDKEGKRSLMITVNRFLTGVSIPKADSMLYMKSTQSPQEYDQAIFRLCTRNVVKTSDGNKINMKPNVYLIDFDISRMFQMVLKSATHQCAAKNQSDITDIEDNISDQLETIPIYSESVWDNSDHVFGRMHQIDREELMKMYVNYNKNKDIESSIKDIFDNRGFEKFISNENNIELVKKFEEQNADRTGLDQKKGKDLLHSDEYGNGVNDNEKEGNAKNNGGDKTNKKLKEEIKARLIGMMKNILYCDICLDTQAKDLKDFLYLIDCNEYNKKVAKNFKLNNIEINNVFQAMDYSEKANINMLLYNMQVLMSEEKLQPVDRALNALAKLGRLDDKKNEEIALVVTPPELVKKMIGKVDRSVFENADSILEVNSKTGEFVVEIYKQFGKKVAEKVKIIPGDLRCKAFIKKVLNLLEISEYNVIEIGDENGDGKFNIKDFLYVKNEEIMKMNNGKKFDICLMNPPYGKLHMKFLQKCSDINNITVSIQPINYFQNAVISNKKLPIAISNIDVIDVQSMCDSFNIGIWVDAGIITIDNHKTNDQTKFYNIIENYEFFKKIKDKNCNSLINLIKKEKTTNYPLRFFIGCHWDKSHNYEGTPKTYENAIKPDENNHIGYICLNSEIERKNLFNYGFTSFYKYCVKIGGASLVPDMGDYSIEWTDEKLFRFFNIDKNQQNIILSTMKPYT